MLSGQAKQGCMRHGDVAAAGHGREIVGIGKKLGLLERFEPAEAKRRGANPTARAADAGALAKRFRRWFFQEIGPVSAILHVAELELRDPRERERSRAEQPSQKPTARGHPGSTR